MNIKFKNYTFRINKIYDRNVFDISYYKTPKTDIVRGSLLRLKFFKYYIGFTKEFILK